MKLPSCALPIFSLTKSAMQRPKKQTTMQPRKKSKRPTLFEAPESRVPSEGYLKKKSQASVRSRARVHAAAMLSLEILGILMDHPRPRVWFSHTSRRRQDSLPSSTRGSAPCHGPTAVGVDDDDQRERDSRRRGTELRDERWTGRDKI